MRTIVRNKYFRPLLIGLTTTLVLALLVVSVVAKTYEVPVVDSYWKAEVVHYEYMLDTVKIPWPKHLRSPFVYERWVFWQSDIYTGDKNAAPTYVYMPCNKSLPTRPMYGDLYCQLLPVVYILEFEFGSGMSQIEVSREQWDEYSVGDMFIITTFLNQVVKLEPVH